MKTRANLVTERSGVNYVRTVVEDAGSIFKEINLQHDYGHDATVMLVVDGVVRPREVALQIKSGKSYATDSSIKIPASAAHIQFWAQHDLVTIGVVFDPHEGSAYWIDLQTASREFRSRDRSSGTVFIAHKCLWNRFDLDQFPNLLVPTLLGEAPNIDIETLVEWLRSKDLYTHDLAVRILRARHYRDPRAWRALFDVFSERTAQQLTLNMGIAFAKLMGHHDIGFYSGEIPDAVRDAAVKEVLEFGANEIAKILSFVEEGDFTRPSVGYSLLPVIAARVDSHEIWKEIMDGPTFEACVRRYAATLLGWQAEDPDCFGFWRCSPGDM